MSWTFLPRDCALDRAGGQTGACSRALLGDVVPPPGCPRGRLAGVIMKHILGLLIIIFSLTGTVWAQSEVDLKQFFEGKTVTLRIDLPATRDGVNIYPERSQPFDYEEYGDRLKRHGAFVRGFEVVKITKLDVRGRQIEIQVAGYGTPEGVARFYIHFNRIESFMLTPVAVVDALGRYVDFDNSLIAGLPQRQNGVAVRRGVMRVGPRSTYLKEGMRTQEVLRLLGQPATVSERTEDGAVVTRYEFDRSEGRIIVAEFVSDALVRSRTETKVAAIITN